MTELKTENVKSVVKKLFKNWVTTPYNYGCSHYSKDDDIDSIVFRMIRDYNAPYNKDLVTVLSNKGINSESKVSDYICNFDNWEFEIDDYMELDDFEASDSFELDMGEHIGCYPEAIARAKSSGKDPVIINATLEEFVYSYDIYILLNNEQTEVLSWALHQD